MQIQIVLSWCLIGFTICQISNDLDKDEIEKQIKGNIPGLENFNASGLPTEEDLEKVLREKCEKNGGGEEAFNALKNQQAEIKECLESQLNSTEIQAEIEEAKKTGSMDEVFGKYCRKYPEIYKCAEEVVEKVKPCLESGEQATMNQTLTLIGELKEFICFKDGDRLAMFIAEGGVECLESRKDELQVCVNNTIGNRIPKDMSLNNLPLLLLTDRECNDFDKIRVCFNDELEKCKDSTPANIIDAFFKFLKKHIPCGGTAATSVQKLTDEKALSDNNSSTSTSLSLLLVGAALIVAKYL